MPTTFQRTANTSPDLSALPIPLVRPLTNMAAHMLGVVSITDNNGGLFYWDYDSVASADGFNIILSNNPIYVDSGRWIRTPVSQPSTGTVATPTFLPAPGQYSSGQQITISCATIGATIYFTTDGSTPNTGSAQYSGPLTLSSDTNYKAIGVLAGYTNSLVGEASYTVSLDQVAIPVFSPTNGTFNPTVDVSITCATSGAFIYWTDDGSTPTVLSNLYTAPFTLASTTTLKAIGIKAGLIDSNIATKVYTLTTLVQGFYGSLFTPTAVAADINVGPVQAWSQTTTQYNTQDSTALVPPLYQFEAVSLEIGPYRYYGVIDTASPAAASASGGYFVSLNLGPDDFAQADEGYNLFDANGWPYYLLALTFAQTGLPDGNYRTYRLLNQLNGAFTLRVRQ